MCNRGNLGAKAINDDNVQVYCLIRPDLPTGRYLEAIPPTTIQMTPNDARPADEDEDFEMTKYSFTSVFPTYASQEDVFERVAKPLVHDLIHQKSGVLFACGTRHSGKTYSMEGSPGDEGIIQRSIEMLFDSIGPHQAQPYVFNPGGTYMNTFRAKDVLLKKQPNNQRKKADCEPEQLHSYRVFLTYYEVYNYTVYDLLADPFDPKRFRPLPCRQGWRFKGVTGCTQKEVMSKKDAIWFFMKGQKNRLEVHHFNPEFWNSYSVVTLKLVSAPLDAERKLIPQHDKVVSQLSLVDLEATELTRRSPTGVYLSEPECFNEDLTALCNCIKVMQENRRTGNKTDVPFHRSILTMIFGSYFEGKGKIGLIACINPLDQYDETKWMMQFAESAETVIIPWYFFDDPEERGGGPSLSRASRFQQ